MKRHRERAAARHGRARLVPASLVLLVLALLLCGVAHAEEVCTPGRSSSAALAAEENRSSGEAHLVAARSLTTADEAHARELAEAEEQFRAAVDATPCLVPLNILRLGQTLELEGHYLAARATFGRLTALRQELSKYRLYAEPLAQALTGEAESSQRVASIEVVVRAAGCADPVALIDGEAAPIGPREHDPGTLRLEASANGCIPYSTSYVLHEGAHGRIELALRPFPAPERDWCDSKTLGVSRCVWVSIAGVALAAGGGYLSYQLLSGGNNAQSVPSGSLGRVTLP